MVARNNGLPARCLATGGMDSSFASRRCSRVAPERSLHRLSMRYDVIVASGSRFPGAKTPERSSCLPTQSLYGTAAAATDVLDRVAGMIKKAVYRSSGRRVRGEDELIPPIKTVAPDLPLDVLRNMDIRRRSVVCTHHSIFGARPAEVDALDRLDRTGPKRASARSAGPKRASACGARSVSAPTGCNAVQRRRPECS